MVALVAALAGAAAGFEPPATEEPTKDSATIATATEMGGPEDLPGKQRGDREKVEAKEPETKEPAAPRSWFGTPWWKWSTMTGDWGGLRTKLEDHGVTVAGSYTFNWSSVWSGGASNRASTRSLLDVNVTFDTAKLTGEGWKGGTLYVDYNSSDDRGKLADSGSYQPTNAIDAGKNIDQITELWYQQKLFDEALRFKVGKIDANAEFDFVNAAADFMSGPSANSPNVVGFPTYPNSATGVVVFVYPTKHWYVGGGLLDGATLDGFATGTRGPAMFLNDDRSSSWFIVGETGYGWDDLGKLGAGRGARGGGRMAPHGDAHPLRRHDG